MTPNPTYSDGAGRVVYCGDALDVLRQLDSESVHCCVTSPPYWGLRDYGTATWEGGDAECDHKLPATGGNVIQGPNKGNNNAEAMPFRSICRKCGARRIDQQIGLEQTPSEYVAKMVAVFEEVRRVLRSDGCAFINLGDSYFGGGGYSPGSPSNQSGNSIQCKSFGSITTPIRNASCGLKPKDLVGIPWSVAFALRDAGWWLRQDIVWQKMNPMPESVRDRCTKAHEYIFMLAKSARYYYDAEAIAEPLTDSSVARLMQPTFDEQQGGEKDYGHRTNSNRSARKALCNLKEKLVRQEKWGDRYEGWNNRDKSIGRNKRSVWTVNTEAYPAAHFATFPTKLVEPMILAGCPEQCCAACGAPWVRETSVKREFVSGSGKSGNPINGKQQAVQGGGETKDIRRGPVRHVTATGFAPTCTCNAATVPGTVLDCFCGSGTTLQVARDLGRNAIGVELNPNYIDLCAKRLEQGVLF